jgi:hypothetical protein
MGRKLTGAKPKPGTIYQRRWRAKVKRRAKSPNARGSEWHTPDRYLAMVRAVFGGSIDCDPASNTTAQQTVLATVYYTAADNGLSRDWIGNVFLNPPYANGLVTKFANKLLDEIEAGRCTEAIALVNAQTNAPWFRRLFGVAAAVCYPDHRIRFVGAPGNPRIGSAFLYFGSDAARFAAVFAPLGHVTGTRLAA